MTVVYVSFKEGKGGEGITTCRSFSLRSLCRCSFAFALSLAISRACTGSNLMGRPYSVVVIRDPRRLKVADDADRVSEGGWGRGRGGDEGGRGKGGGERKEERERGGGGRRKEGEGKRRGRRC